MKIHILRVKSEFQPPRQNFRCPAHGQDWNVERDFSFWLREGASAQEADWDYLPIWWNLYYINEDWGHQGLDELQIEIDRLISPERPTFTICEYDLPGLQPFLELHGMRIFTASRRSADPALIDIPLLCSKHETVPVEKRWLASFNGNLSTDGIRIDMADAFRGKPDVYVSGQWMDPPKYAELIASSYVALAPRGQGAQSFRFYEAMQIGTVPLMISDIDPRPFKRWIDWDSCSLWAKTPDEAVALVYGVLEEDLAQMGQRAQQVYLEDLQYGKWCPYVLRELECLS